MQKKSKENNEKKLKKKTPHPTVKHITVVTHTRSAGAGRAAYALARLLHAILHFLFSSPRDVLASGAVLEQAASLHKLLVIIFLFTLFRLVKIVR